MLLIASMGLGSSCAVSCPAALLEGELVESEGELAVQASGGHVTFINWFDGNSVAREGETLVLKDWFGLRTLATEGEHVRVGGGQEGRAGRDTTRWYACGSIVKVVP